MFFASSIGLRRQEHRGLLGRTFIGGLCFGITECFVFPQVGHNHNGEFKALSRVHCENLHCVNVTFNAATYKFSSGI